MVDLEAQRPRSVGFKRRRSAPTPRVPRSASALAFLVFVAVLWHVEIHSLVWYRLHCENLSHRDQRFVHRDNYYLCLSDREVASVLRDLALTAAAVFEAHNVTYFLESGTLLGAFRERGVIRHDDDVDLGIDAAGLQYLRTHAVEFPDGYTIDVWSSPVYPGSTRDDKLPVRVTHTATGLYADVFAFLEWEDDTVGPLPSVCFKRCAACPYVGEFRHFKVPREWVFPLVDCAFEGHTLKCPREAAKYLEHMYGPHYMTPS